MPFVKFVTSEKMDSAKRDEIRSIIWDSITTLPNKTPEVTMVEIEDGADIMKGPGGAPAIFCETRVFTAAPFAAKDAYVRKLSANFESATGVKPPMMYFNFLEFNEWGSGGGYKIL